jgi:hypothetical protein
MVNGENIRVDGGAHAGAEVVTTEETQTRKKRNT